MPSLDTYSKNQLSEISLLFKNDSYYADLYNSHYSAASKKVEESAKRIRNQILYIVDSALESEEKKAELPELTSLLIQYHSLSHPTPSSSKQEKKQAQHAQESTRLLLEIIHNFSTQFKFESPTDYASTLVNLSSDEYKVNFQNLQAYRALTRKQLHALNGSSHTYSRVEEEALVKTFGIKKKEDLDNLAQKFTLDEIYKKLDESYKKVCEIPYVKTTFKTNHLKTAGVHGKNILIGIAVALGVGALFSFTPIAGAPTVNPSMEAVINFWVGQMLPIAGIGLGAGSASSTLSAIVDNRTTQQLRNQVRDLTPDQKEILFQLVKKYTPTKENKLTQKEAFARFNEELKENGINLKWGARKRAKFQHLVDSEKEITEKLAKTLPGATKRQQRKKNKYDEKVLEERNADMKSLANERLSKILSPKNPACIHMGITGRKSRSKNSDTTEKNQTPSFEYTKAQLFAREEENTTSKTLDLETTNQIRAFLKRPGAKAKTFKAEIKESEFYFEISMRKSETQSYESAFKEIMADIQEKIASNDEYSTELTYEVGLNIGKNRKRSIDVTITPRKKDK